MEFGLFIFLIGVGIIGYVRRTITFTTLSVAVFFILAVLLSTNDSNAQVIWTHSLNSTKTITNATGSTTGQEKTLGSDTVVVLGSNLTMVSYIFFAAAIAATILCIRSFIGFVAWA